MDSLTIPDFEWMECHPSAFTSWLMKHRHWIGIVFLPDDDKFYWSVFDLRIEGQMPSEGYLGGVKPEWHATESVDNSYAYTLEAAQGAVEKAIKEYADAE